MHENKEQEDIQAKEQIKALQEKADDISSKIVEEENNTEDNDPTEKDHVHSETCGHSSHQKSSASHNHQPQLTSKEMNALKKGKYHEAINKFKLSHVILNKKTGVIVEMKAASSVHACKMIGWKPNHCKVLSIIDREAESKNKELDGALEKSPETVSEK